MSKPTQDEIDAVTDVSMCGQAEAVDVIQALDKLRGECVPVDKLRAWNEHIFREHPGYLAMVCRLGEWLDRNGWLDE